MGLQYDFTEPSERHGEHHFIWRLMKEEDPELFEELRPKTYEERTRVLLPGTDEWLEKREEQSKRTRAYPGSWNAGDNNTPINIVDCAPQMWHWKDETKTEIWRIMPKTDTLIHISGLVECGNITEKNHEEWFRRVFILQRLDGPLFDGVIITLSDVQLHIGLKTNTDNIDNDEFDAKIANWARWNADTELKKQKKGIE